MSLVADSLELYTNRCSYCIGAISFASALKIAYLRGLEAERLRKCSEKLGAMMAVAMSRSQIQPHLDEVNHAFNDPYSIQIGCYNSHSNITVSGQSKAIHHLKTRLEAVGTWAHILKVEIAYHSFQMNEIAESYKESIDKIEPGRPDASGRCVMISTVSGKRVTPDELQRSSYWAANMISPVNFAEPLAKICSATVKSSQHKLDGGHTYDLSSEILVEIGPHSALRSAIRETIAASGNQNVEYIPTLIRSTYGPRVLLQLVGNLHCAGYHMVLKKVNFVPPSSRPKLLVDLPGYAFDHSVSYWQENRISRQTRLRATPETPFLGRRVADWNSLEPRWRMFLSQNVSPWTKDHVVGASMS